MCLKFSYKNSQKISISKLIRINAFIEGIKIFPTVIKDNSWCCLPHVVYGM